MITLNKTAFLVAILEATRRVYGSDQRDPLKAATELGLVPENLPAPKKAERIRDAIEFFGGNEWRQFHGVNLLAGLARAEAAWDNYQELLAGEQDQPDPGEEAEQGC